MPFWPHEREVAVAPFDVAVVPVACRMLRPYAVSRGYSRSEITQGAGPFCVGQAPFDAGGRCWFEPT
jgi:hypothetical protein